MRQFTINILPGIIIAVLSIWLTWIVSLRRFYAEKWWERKEKAYEDIIDALYVIRQYCDIQRNDYGQGGASEELETRYNAAYWKLKKVTDIAAFVVSSHETEIVLQELRDRPQPDWDKEPPWDSFHQEYIYYDKALRRLVQSASKDLKATKSRLRFRLF